jgi:hypothetical protein
MPARESTDHGTRGFFVRLERSLLNGEIQVKREILGGRWPIRLEFWWLLDRVKVIFLTLIEDISDCFGSYIFLWGTIRVESYSL